MAKIKEEKQTSAQILAELEKKFGLNTAKDTIHESVHSGSYKLNLAMGTDGYVKGKLVEIYGPESCGKSTLVLHAIAEFQKAVPDKLVALYDFEHSFDKTYAQAIGVNMAKLKLYQPDYQEQGFDLLLNMVEKELISLAVIDSHTAAIPKAIIEGDMGDATMALQARNNSKFLGKIKGLLEKTNTSLLAISQIRAAVGSMGETNISTGGNSWKFYSDMRFKIWKLNDKVKELNKTTIDVIKNKCSNPFGQAVVNIEWGIGISEYSEILDLACEQGFIKKAGSWFSSEIGDKLGQGSDAVIEMFKSNNSYFQEVKEKTLNSLELKIYKDKKETILEVAKEQVLEEEITE